MLAIQPKAEAVKRQRYTQRLRARLQGMTTAGEIWRAAYLAGYRAAYAGYLRKIRKGEIVVVKERRVRWDAA